MEFIDCSSLSFNYNVKGDVNISFSVISDKPASELGSYTSLTFGSRTFNGYITNVTVSEIEYTRVFQYQFQLVAITGSE